MSMGVCNFKVPVLVKNLNLVLLPVPAAAELIDTIYRNRLFIGTGHCGLGLKLYNGLYIVYAQHIFKYAVVVVLLHLKFKVAYGIGSVLLLVVKANNA